MNPAPRSGPEAAPYPRFSEAEMRRRHEAVTAAMHERGVEHAVVYGANRFGSAVGWLTRWPVTREALVVFTPGERDVLFVDFYNHIPNAERIATEAEVRWTGARAIESAIDELRRRGGSGRRIGVIGSLGHAAWATLAELAGEMVDLTPDYTRMRLVKSAEELDWLRVGTRLTDRGLEALRQGMRPGLDEHQLGDLVERAYAPLGGRTHIHYFGVTPMSAPGLSAPAQWPANREVAMGDAVTCELSASFWDYPGQVLRTFAVAAEPTEQYRDLHAVADAAFDVILERLRPGTTAADLVAAASVVEDAGYTTRDDLVHGFVGGYLPPVIGSPSRQLTEVPDFTFEPGMTVVVQPNVVTRDERAGVQTGELVLVTESGPERLHDAERGLHRVR